jgi:hypothetical protein
MKRRSKYTYIPKDEISEVITFNNVSFESDDLLDGAYVKGRKKYARGGNMRDMPLEEQAAEAVGYDVWFSLDAPDKSELVEELVRSGMIIPSTSEVDMKILELISQNDEYVYMADGGMMAKGGEIEVGDYVKYKKAKYHATVIDVVNNVDIPYAKIEYPDGMIVRAYLQDLRKIQLGVAEEYSNTELMDRMRKEWQEKHGSSTGSMMAKGGDVGQISVAKSYWNKFDKKRRIDFLIGAGYSKSVANDLSSESWDSLEKGVHNDLRAVLMADGGMMAKGGMSHSDQMIDRMNEERVIEEQLYVDKFYNKEGEFIGWTIKDKANPIGRYTLRKDKEEAENNRKYLIDNPSVLKYYRKNQYADGGMMADGGVATAGKFKVKYYLKESPELIKEKIFDDKDKAELFFETIQEDDDIMVSPIEEMVMVAAAAPKKSLFASAKPAPASTAAAKKKRERVQVDGISGEISRYDELKAIINNAKAEQEIIGGRLKEIGREKFMDIYEDRGFRPPNFDLADGNENILLEVKDMYLKVEPEKAAILEQYSGILEVKTTYNFNSELLEKEVSEGMTIGDVVSMLIQDSKLIPDSDKENLIKAETTMKVAKGTIDRLLDYDNPREIFNLISPILALK